MKVFILRHGTAEPAAARDCERRLSAQGREGLSAVFTEKCDSLASVTQVLASPYVRAQQTLNMALPYLNGLPEGASLTCDFLTPSGNPHELVDWLYSNQPTSCLIVSHQPLVGTLLDSLCSFEPGQYRMGTGALASIDLDVPAMGLGRLNWLVQAPE